MPVINTRELMDELVTRIHAVVPEEDRQEFWDERFVPFDKEKRTDSHLIMADGVYYLKYPYNRTIKAALLGSNVTNSKFSI